MPRDPDQNLPDVSFIVASYNVAAYVEEALETALAQEGVDLEAIVVDDFSTDGSAGIVERLAANDARIRVERSFANGGPSAARNRALALARGKWIAVLDADDMIEADRTVKLLDLADATSADIVADNVHRFSDATGASLGSAFPCEQDYAFAIDAPSYLESNVPLEGGFGLGYLKPMIRRDFIMKHQLAYDESVWVGEDFLLCLQALLSGARYIAMSRPSYRYRVREGSLSHRLSPDEVECLSRGFGRYEAWPGVDGETAAAILQYRRGLNRVRDFVQAVDDMRHSSTPPAMLRLALRPDLWNLVVKYGGQAAAKRIGRRFIIH